VENAFSALIKQQARGQILGQGVASLTKARASSLAAYKGGVSSLLDVLDADQGSVHRTDPDIRSHDCHPRRWPSLLLRWPRDQRSH
jgi:hypothetical protein